MTTSTNSNRYGHLANLVSEAACREQRRPLPEWAEQRLGPQRETEWWMYGIKPGDRRKNWDGGA